MKAFLSPTRLFLLGFALLLAANIIALLGVATNRSGKPEAVIELTERELRLPYKTNDENSGLALELKWRIIEVSADGIYDYYSNWGAPAWFNAQKLAELGFTIDESTCPGANSKREKVRLPKDAFIVLEYEGNAYREALQRAEESLKKAEAVLKARKKDKGLQDRFKEAKEQLDAERTSASRLFAIDAGLDAGKLRERYSEGSKFIIMRGIVRLACRSGKNKKEVVGYISDIRVDKINVPLRYRKIFDVVLAQDTSERRERHSPRYKVEVAYGSRFEPWIRGIDKLIQ
jgi:hypothetical protein